MIGFLPFPPLAKGARGIWKSTLSEAHAIPSAAGTYALLLFCRHARTADIGKLGAHPIPRGWYVYVGSAFGPGGLRARCLHHLRPVRRLHWHIDYLKSAASLQSIWFTPDPVRREHQWAATIQEMKGADMPVPGFGSSDCLCQTHLMHFPTRPSFSIFQRQALGRVPAHGPIMECRAPARQARRNVL